MAFTQRVGSALAVAALSLALAQPVCAQPTATQNYWQQFVHYTMDVTLDPAAHMLAGTSHIRYRNNSPDKLDRIYMYLYPNGFKDNNTIRAQEAAKFYVKNLAQEEDAGWLKINEFRFLPKNKTASAEQATSAFQVNDTILEAALPEPLLPGEEIAFELSFTSKVRKFQDRAGYRGEQYDFAQWYPKLCVYDEEGWHAEPLHFTGEFYGEFGTFDMKINVPFEYIVGATGEVTAGDPGWSVVSVDTTLDNAAWQKKHEEMKAEIKKQSADTKMRSVSFHAENVHDFAWITSSDFLYERGAYDGIPIHVLYRSYAKPSWTKVVTERGRRSLEWLSTKFGRYPYPQLTITHGLLGGGMEYPMLVMNSSEDEGLILHEVGHIYFFGIFGNNEQKEAWLDEGFTSFQTRWYFETRYGPLGYDVANELKDATWLARHRPFMSARASNRDWAMTYMKSGLNEPISKLAYQYTSDMGYGVNAYTKGSIFYEMLRYVVGEENFARICHEYFNRWALKHVNEARFRQVCEDVSGMDLGWFFQQWLHEAELVDYSLGNVRSEQAANGNWQTTVEIKRNDEGIMPAEVELTFADGSKATQRWSGKERSGTLTFNTASKPARVVLDPSDQIMDKSRLGHGNLRVELLPEYPRMWNYNPNDAYVITWKPSAWYNDVDGARVGVKFKGRYLDTRNLEVGAWYGVKSSALDGSFKFSNKLASRTNYHLAAAKLEGRYHGDVSVTTSFSKMLFTPPQWNFRFGFNYFELPFDKAEYAATKIEVEGDAVVLPNWSPGKVNRAYLNFNVNPRGMSWRSFIRGQIAHANESFGSDATYTRLEGELRFWIPAANGDGLYVRGFAGGFLREKDDKPWQDLFSAFGASTREQFEQFYTRSRGALPAELHYHLPGGGNLRGYYDQPRVLLGKNLIAGNVELRKAATLPVLGKILRRVLGRSTFSVFFDYGRLASPFTDEKNNLADAGVGVVFQKTVPDNWYSFILGTNYTLRVDFPIWVNEPRMLIDASADDEIKFRYVFSLQRAL